MKAKLAGDSGLSLWRVCRKTIAFAAPVMHLFYLRPDLVEMAPYTISAEAYYPGDGGTAITALTARAQGNLTQKFANADHYPVSEKRSIYILLD